MLRQFEIVLAASVYAAWFASPVSAEQTTTADGHVVHTRLAPVAVHRIFPPYTGIHVYARGPRGRAAQGDVTPGGIEQGALRSEVIVQPTPFIYPGPIYVGSGIPWQPYYPPSPPLFPTSTRPHWAY